MHCGRILPRSSKQIPLTTSLTEEGSAKTSMMYSGGLRCSIAARLSSICLQYVGVTVIVVWTCVEALCEQWRGKCPILVGWAGLGWAGRQSVAVAYQRTHPLSNQSTRGTDVLRLVDTILAEVRFNKERELSREHLLPAPRPAPAHQHTRS